MANAAISMYWIMTGDEELRKKATAKLGYLVDKVGEQIFVPVEMVERGLSIAQGNRKTNVTRTLITMWGGDNYNPKKADRDFYEKFQYGLFGKNARYIKDDSKKTNCGEECEIMTPLNKSTKITKRFGSSNEYQIAIQRDKKTGHKCLCFG